MFLGRRCQLLRSLGLPRFCLVLRVAGLPVVLVLSSLRREIKEHAGLRF